MRELIPDGFEVCVLLGAVVLLIGMTLSLWHSWVVYSGAPTRRPVDMSGLSYAPSKDVAPIVDELLRLDFRRLGETTVPVPLVSESPNAWILVDPDETIQAEVVPFGPFMGFTSYFPDRAVVTTSYPKGESIDRPDFRWSTVDSSVADALAAHRASLVDYQRRHGQPVRISTMAEYLRWDAIDRELYTATRLRGALIRTSIPTVVLAVAASVVIVGLVRG